MQQGQFGKCCEVQAVMLTQADAGQGSEVLGMQKQHGALAQALIFVGIQAVEYRQAGAYRRPGAIGDGMASQPAPLAPSLE